VLTGFYVDNGPFLPLWNRLPYIAYWLLRWFQSPNRQRARNSLASAASGE
jgi:hypothetical protein